MAGHWNGLGTNERGVTVARSCVALLRGNHRSGTNVCNGETDEGTAFEVAA
jgi:hypothetical protein